MNLKVLTKRLSLMSTVAWVMCAVGAANGGESPSPSISYSKDIAPIIFKHCVTCHRPGEAVPMTMMNFEETRPWVKAIKNAVVSRAMPPWHADPAFGDFLNDISLDDEQISKIVQWVDAGAPQGNPSEMPAPPEFKSGWQLGEPDYVLNFPKAEIAAEGKDSVTDLLATIQIPEKRWIRALEVKPGNRAVLHHAVLFANSPKTSIEAGNFDALAVWAVGAGPLVYPEATGRWINPGIQITANMHYHSTGKPESDASQVGLYFGKGPVAKEVRTAIMPVIGFVIPAHATDYRLESSFFVHEDIRVISWFPHMHFRGKAMRFTAIYPDGKRETILNVPKYDFKWQAKYYPREPKLLPAKTEILLEAVFDNSENNPFNPDPTRNVPAGEGSGDEMMMGFFEHIAASEGPTKPRTREWNIEQLQAKYPKGEFHVLEPQVKGSTLLCFYVPKQNDRGLVYYPIGDTELWPLELLEIKWSGPTFTCNMMMAHAKSARLRGTLDSQGKLIRIAAIQ